MSDFQKYLALAIVAVVLLGAGALLVFGEKRDVPLPEAPVVIAPPVKDPHHEVIGKSVEGRTIDAYTYGTGTTHLLFVGGIHGGYEWNSVLLAYALMDYLDANPKAIPAHLSVTVIPSANPDGVHTIIGKEGRFSLADAPSAHTDVSAGRFNAHKVDLNRNFDCKWKPESMWRSKVVSAGTAPFSEPESAAIRDFVRVKPPTAAIFFHSQSNAVYASECKYGILSETLEIMNVYAQAAKYPAVKTFDSYAITGDVEGWLASINIPAITVELATHETIEWERNLKGIKALFDHYRAPKG